MPSTEQVMGINNVSFEVDISVGACIKFGFSHGDRVEVIVDGRQGTVVGVAPLPGGQPAGCLKAGTDTLWIRMDGSGGKVCFFPDPLVNLKKV